MKRLLLLCALLWASPAYCGKVLVVMERGTSGGQAGTQSAWEDSQLQQITHLLDLWHASYSVTTTRAAATEWVRTGTMVWNNSTAEQFDAVIVSSFNARAPNATGWTRVRTDSLTLTVKLPTVPTLFLLDGCANSATAFVDASTCTLGVSAQFISGGGGGTHEGERSVYQIGWPESWHEPIYGIGLLRNDTPPNGGIRTLLSYGANPVSMRYELSGTLASNMDSCGRSATGDSMMAFLRLNAHKAGASPEIFVCATGGATPDSAGNDTHMNGYNYQAVMCGLALLDSLTGRKLLVGPPVRKALVAIGGGTTSGERHPGGLWTPDSVAFKASGDSCGTKRVAGHRLRFTVAAAPESLTAQEVKWWARFGEVRYTPWVRLGIDSAAAGNTVASTTLPVDPWGRWRKRAFGGDGTAADTSVTALLKAARANLAAAVGAANLSRLAVPVDDDWTPLAVRPSAGALPDSEWIAMHDAGFTSVLVNHQQRKLSATNPQGWYPAEGTHDGVRALWHSGWQTTGSAHFAGAQDSVFPVASAPPANVAVYEDSRFWNGALSHYHRDLGFTSDQVVWPSVSNGIRPLHDILWGIAPLDCFVIPMQGFGGSATATSAATRPSYWNLKHMVDGINVINRFAGRTLIDLTWPEDIQ